MKHPNDRPIREFERELIERILAFNPVLRGLVLSVPVGAMVQEIPAEGTIRLLETSGRDKKQRIQNKYPVEAQCADIDGVSIHALVFVVGDEVSELELYKDDSSAILSVPPIDKWLLIDLSHAG